MANWCEGTMKVRGSKENIINFMKNCLFSVTWLGIPHGSASSQL